LAQLLRRLRAIRKDKLSREQLAERVNVALSEAWSTGRSDTAADGGSVDGFGAAALTHLDNRLAS
jgi:hypothetical protein